MRIWGIPNCDTTRNALKALRAAGRDVALIDVRETGLEPALIDQMITELGEKVLNKASTTYRGLSDADKALPVATLLAQHPTLMKRPVIEEGGVWTMGWAPAVQAKWL